MSEYHKAAQMRAEFYGKHKNADYIVFDERTHLPIGAIYYSPDWHDTPEIKEGNLKKFFSEVQKAVFVAGLDEE